MCADVGRFPEAMNNGSLCLSFVSMRVEKGGKGGAQRKEPSMCGGPWKDRRRRRRRRRLSGFIYTPVFTVS